MQIFKGKIITCDRKDNVFEYLVEEGGRILYTGNALPGEFKGGAVTELGRRALLPSFGDAHLHFSNWALVAGAFFDVRSARDFYELGTLITEFAVGQPKMKVLTAFGASKHSVEEKRLITRDELDAIYAERPLYIICYDGHSSIANSKMIEMLPEKVKSLRGFHAETGHFFHEAYYAATDFISGSIATPTLVNCIVSGYDRLAENGIIQQTPRRTRSVVDPGQHTAALDYLAGYTTDLIVLATHQQDGRMGWLQKQPRKQCNYLSYC